MPERVLSEHPPTDLFIHDAEHTMNTPPDCSRILLAIPVFNEARYIETVLSKATRFARDILVIDDGSKMAKPGIPAFTAPVVKAPEPLLCCGSRQADQPAMSMTPCSAARPFVA